MKNEDGYFDDGFKMKERLVLLERWFYCGDSRSHIHIFEIKDEKPLMIKTITLDECFYNFELMPDN